MPAKSKAQRGAAGAALREKRGGPKAKGAGHLMAQSMTEEQLRHHAGTPSKGLPAKAKPKAKGGKPALPTSSGRGRVGKPPARRPGQAKARPGKR